MAAAPPSDNVFIGDLPVDLSKEDCEAVFAQYGTVTSCRVNPPKAGGKASALVRFASVEEATWVIENLNGNLAEGLEEPIVARFANAPGGGGKGWGDSQGGKSWGKGDQSWGGKGGKSWGGKGDESWGGKRSEPYSSGKGKGKGKGGGQSWDGGKGGGKSSAPASFQILMSAVKKQGLLGGGHIPIECQVYVKNLPSDTTDADLYKLFAPFGAIAPTGAKAMQNPDGTCKGIGFIDYADQLCADAAITALNNFTLPDGSSIQVSTKANKADGKGGGKGGK
mmetsp:Transcript_53876/g.136805  ORF Transcript_53876/g.136805 Transcript_53876/m.136805 type:complete len:280 (+) Transcript_53876:65-904(+)